MSTEERWPSKMARDEEPQVEQEPLVISASLGEEGSVRGLMRTHVGKNKPVVGRAIIAAAHAGHEKVADLLLKTKADVNDVASGQALDFFIRDHDNYNVVQIFCRAGLNPAAHISSTIFERAADHGKGDGIKAVQVFLECKFDPNSNSGYKGLQLSAQSGHERIVEALLEAKANPNCHEGAQAMVTASLMGQFKVVNLLLDACADACSPEGNEALNCAVHTGNSSLVDLLIDSDADPSAGLAAASFRNNNGFVKLLLARKADAHSRRKAIKEAARFGHEEVMRTLLKAGVETRSPAGDAALRLAVCNSKPPGVQAEIVEALEHAGAKRFPKRVLSLPALPGGRTDQRRPSKTWAGGFFSRSIGPWNMLAGLDMRERPTSNASSPRPYTGAPKHRTHAAPALRMGRRD